MPTHRAKRSRKATRAFFSAEPPPTGDQAENVRSGQADSASITTGAAEVHRGLPLPSATAASAPSSSSALSALSSVSEPRSNSCSAPALATATATEKACLLFCKFAINIEERILAEEDDTDLARDRANIGKSFAIGDFKEEMAHVEIVEEELEIAHDLKTIMLDIRGEKDKGVDFQLDERNEALASACRSMELSNLEKRFGFFREETRGIVARAESWSGRKLKQEPKSLRQIFNDPMSLVEEDIPTETQKRPKEANLVVALSDFHRLSKVVLQDVQAFNRNFACEEAELPQQPPTITYRGCRLPDAVPERIRKSAWDLHYIQEDMLNLRDQLLPLRETVRNAMVIWITASSTAWEYGVAHIHEFANLREYEYLRTSLQASNLLGQREEHKILSYFLSDGSSKGVCLELQTKIFEDGLDLAKPNKGWDDRKQLLMDYFVPVDEMVKRLNPRNFSKDEEAKIVTQRKEPKSTLTSTKQ